MADNNKKITFTVEVNDKGKVKVDGLTKGFVNLDNAVKKVNKSIIDQSVAMNQVAKTNQNMIDKTGLAGATIVELGRTISDSNYGIRGMANNLSQLSTLMITLIATTGGLKQGINALTKAFMGPLGFIIGFQVVVALLERFDMQASKTKKEIDNIGSASAAAGSNLKILRDVMDDSTLSTEELERAVNKANKEYKGLNIQIDENGRITEESRKQIDLKILSLERLAKATAIQKEIEKVFTKIVKTQVEEREKIAELEKGREKREEQRLLASQNKTQAAQSAFFRGIVVSTDEAIQKVKDGFIETRKELTKELNALTGVITEEDLLDELFKTTKGKGLGKRAKERLLEFDNELKNFFLDIDKDGVEGILVKGVERVKNIYQPLFESAKEGSGQLKMLGEDFNEIQERNQESLKNGLQFIKDQAKDVTDLFKATQQSLKFVSDTILSYHDARMDALKRERDYVLNSGELTGSAQKKAIEDIERRELQAQRRKIKAERDLFTIKQSLLIAEELMRIKADFAERKRMFEQQTVYFVNAQGRIVAKAAESTADATFSIGEFTRQLGPLGIAAYAVTIGGLIASILSARKKAQATLSSLGAPSVGGGSIGGGGGIEAPDFNVVGASPESQLAQSVSQQQTQPLRAFVVHKDIKDANELDRSIDVTRTLG
jgi:hypothetical protein